MPWFPDFVSAAELARRQSLPYEPEDPVTRYLSALSDGSPHALEAAWPGRIVVHDPRAGEVTGHRELRRFVATNQEWLRARHARIETVSSTADGSCAAVELLARLEISGTAVAWPVAVVAEATDRYSLDLRTYCSQVVVDGRRHRRAPLLGPGAVPPDGVVGRYLAGLEAGDVDEVVATFAEDGYLREAVGEPDVHRGEDGLRSFYSRLLGTGDGVALECCQATDDGVRCVVEYNDVSTRGEWPPQAGLAVFERADDGRIAAVRCYDDIERPAAGRPS